MTEDEGLKAYEDQILSRYEIKADELGPQLIHTHALKAKKDWNNNEWAQLHYAMEMLVLANVVDNSYGTVVERSRLSHNAYKIIFSVEDEWSLIYWIRMRLKVAREIRDIRHTERAMRVNWVFTYRRPQGHTVEFNFQTTADVIGETPGGYNHTNAHRLIRRIKKKLLDSGLFKWRAHETETL